METPIIIHLKRVFKFKKDKETVTLVDPNPEFTSAEVIQFYSNQYTCRS